MGTDLDEHQADIPSTQLWELTKALRSAESCETFEDFRANVHKALLHAEIIVTALRDLEKELAE